MQKSLFSGYYQYSIVWVCLHAQCCFCLRIVVERDVVHAEVWLQALEGAVRHVHGATAAVAT